MSGIAMRSEPKAAGGVMKSRSFVTSFVGILAIASMLLPVAANARGDGFVGGSRGFAFRGTPRPFGVRPFIAPRGVASFAVRRPPAARMYAARFMPLQRAHRFFGPGLPATGIGVSYGSYYDPTLYGSYFDPTAYVAPAENVIPYVQPTSTNAGQPTAYTVGCRSQTVTVPSERGGERTVTITRC